MSYPKDAKSLKLWEDGLSHAIAKDSAPWNAYDAKIKTVVQRYNEHLRGVSSFQPLDWQIVKTMIWVESGANNDAWLTAPMQIGVNGDPGLRDLLTSPHGKMILPPEYASTLTVLNVPTGGERNIQAGTGYLLKILAKFGMVPTIPAAPKVPSMPQMPALKLAHHPHHHAHAATHLAIVGWHPATLEFIAHRYNSGDGNYAGKLRFALDIIQGKVVPPLAPPPPPAHHHHQHAGGTH